MGRTPNPTRRMKDGMNKGPWTALENKILIDFVKKNGEGKWSRVSKQTDLRRCGKSCRLRWLNYLRPGIRRGNISNDEEELILRLHKLLGNRWSLIAGRLPGRTDNEIKNHWNTVLKKKLSIEPQDPVVAPSTTNTDRDNQVEKKPGILETNRKLDEINLYDEFINPYYLEDTGLICMSSPGDHQHKHMFDGKHCILSPSSNDQQAIGELTEEMLSQWAAELMY